MPFPHHTKYPDLHEEVVLLFRDAQLEMVHRSLCGDYHPPELHLAPLTPFDDCDPEEA
jgi:hypothetical protein